MKYLICSFLLFLPLLSHAQVNLQSETETQNEQSQAFAWLMVRSDYKAEVFVNGVSYGQLEADKILRVPANLGDNLIQLTEGKDGKPVEKLVVVSKSEKGASKLIEIFFDAPPTAVTNRNKIPENMVFVKGGTFKMGNKKGRRNERPVHEVTLSNFYIGKHEVTVAEYRQYCRQTSTEMPKEPDGGWEDDKPIVNVNWYEAMDYCKWMGGRLPTEAEWEYAARGGHKMDQAHKFSGSDEHQTVAWTRANSLGKLRKVMQLEPNVLGLYDMSGNAWEWVFDPYKRRYYKKSPKKDPVGPGKSPFQVLRGGSWATKPSTATVSHRYNFSAKGWHKTFGFRLVIPSHREEE